MLRADAAKVTYVFPGQGAQWVGMGRDLHQSFPVARSIFEMADEALSFPLSRLCFEGPEEELRQTINVHPAVLVVSIACLRAFQELGGEGGLPIPSFVAGHSLGEYTSLVAAGMLSVVDAVRLVRERGRLMHEAGQANQGGMVAVMGIDQVSLEEICQQTGTQIANINSPGQIVVSGAREALAQMVEMAKSRGARRTVALEVSGAFHSPLMRPALAALSQVISSQAFAPPRFPIVANTTAQPLTSAEAIKEELIEQLCHCVQWQSSIEYMIGAGVSTFIEIGPGQVLSGLIKRISKEVQTLNIGDVPSVKAVGIA